MSINAEVFPPYDDEPQELFLVGADQVDQDEAAMASAADAVRAYLNEIGRTKLLNAEEEVELAKRVEAGVFAARLVLLASPETDEAEREMLRTAGIKLFAHGARPTKGLDQIAAWESAKVAPEKEAEFDAIVERLAGTPEQRQRLGEVVLDGEAAKDRLLSANLRLVVSVAKRYNNRGGSMGLLDLIQEGNLGLIRAVEKFDYTKGYKFSTYATWWIRQSVTRGIADKERVIRLPVHTIEKVNKINAVGRALQQQLGREATPEEIAKQLGIPADAVDQLLQDAKEPVSLDKGSEGGDRHESAESLGEFISSDQPTPYDEVARKMVSEGLMRELAHPDLGMEVGQKGWVLAMRFGILDGNPLTLDQIGAKMGRTRERVRQLEAQAKRMLAQRDGMKQIFQMLEEA